MIRTSGARAPSTAGGPTRSPGSSCQVRALKSGLWVLAYNDTEAGRHSLAVSLSNDEGRTWKWTRHLERDELAGFLPAYAVIGVICGVIAAVGVVQSWTGCELWLPVLLLGAGALIWWSRRRA